MQIDNLTPGDHSGQIRIKEGLVQTVSTFLKGELTFTDVNVTATGTAQQNADAIGQQGGFLLRQGRPPELFSECDPPIGVIEPYDFERHTVQLQPGDRLVLFTDGVSEARSPSGELYGVERVARFLTAQPSGTTGRQLVDALEKDVLAFTGGIYTDDTAILHFHFNS